MFVEFHEVSRVGVAGRVREDDENESSYAGTLLLTINTQTQNADGEFEQDMAVYVLDAHVARALRFEFDQRVEGDPVWEYGPPEAQEIAEQQSADESADVGNVTG